MDAPLGRHFVLEQAVDHAVARGLHFRLESIGGDEYTGEKMLVLCEVVVDKTGDISIPEVCFLGSVVFHGLVVGVLMRIVEDFQGGWFEGFRHLCCISIRKSQSQLFRGEIQYWDS